MLYLIAGTTNEAATYAEERQLQQDDFKVVKQVQDLPKVFIAQKYIKWVGSWPGRADLANIQAHVNDILVTNTMQYSIDQVYCHRDSAQQSDTEIDQRDECQDLVYEQAHGLFKLKGLKTVLDLGCGSGFKLMKHFGKLRKDNILGVDRPETVEFLRQKYKNKHWEVLNFGSGSYNGHINWNPDLVICADVLEHLPNPNAAMDFIFYVLKPKVVVLSTPDRARLQLMFMDGPPRNTAHYREWTFEEFDTYVKRYIPKIATVNHYHPVDTDCVQILTVEF